MRHATLSLLLVTLVVFMVGCKAEVETSGSLDSGVPTPAADDNAVADDETTEDAEPAGPQVLAATVGDEVDEDETTITNETEEFTPDTPAVYCRVELTGITVGSVVSGTLVAVSVVDADGTEGSDIEVASKEVEAPVAEFPVTFTFTLADKLWPVGDYTVVIAVDGEALEEVPLYCVGDDEEPTE